MGLKELLLGHKKYCVYATNEEGDCLTKCFKTRGEAKLYKKKACNCYIETRSRRRRPYSDVEER